MQLSALPKCSLNNLFHIYDRYNKISSYGIYSMIIAHYHLAKALIMFCYLDAIFLIKNAKLLYTLYRRFFSLLLLPTKAYCITNSLALFRCN